MHWSAYQRTEGLRVAALMEIALALACVGNPTLAVLAAAFRGPSGRSPESFLLGEVEPHLQLPSLPCSPSSRWKEFARRPPGMAIEDVPCK